MSIQENRLDHHMAESAPSPSTSPGAVEGPRNLSSTRSITSSSGLPAPPQLHHHASSSANSTNNLNNLKREQASDGFESSNLEHLHSSRLPSPSNNSSDVGGKRVSSYARNAQFPGSCQDSADNSTQNGYGINSSPYHHQHHHHSYHHQHSQQHHQPSSPLSSPMPPDLGSQSQHTLRNEDSYHPHHSSLYDSQILLHHHPGAAAHAHQSLHFHHDVPLGVNSVASHVAHHPYIQSPSPHNHFHQGGGHPNLHHSHYDPEDYSPGKKIHYFPFLFLNSMEGVMFLIFRYKLP